MRHLIKFFIDSPVLVNVLTVLVFVLGSYSAMLIQRESFPNVDFENIRIVTLYPGASAQTVESLVTNPLEQLLLELDGIKTIESVSTQSLSIISIELDGDVITSNEAKSNAQDIVEAWNDRPSDLEDPQVIAVQSSLFPVITVALSGEVDEQVLRAAAKNLERTLEYIPSVSRVNVEGVRDYEITIEASSNKMKKYDLSLQELINSLRNNNQNVPGGSIIDKATGEEVIIRTVGELTSVEDVKNIVVRSNTMATPIYLKDVASVNTQFAKRKTYKRTNGKPSQNLVVLKKQNADIIELVDRVKTVVEDNAKYLPQGVSYDFIDDSSYFVKRRIGVLTNNLIIGLILVLIVLSLVLPIRIAIISAFGIPFAFLTAIALMYFLGVSINIISMLGLILVVGMLVDDAVVVTENACRLMETGKSPRDAAIESTVQIWPPLLTSVSTSMIAFIPLLFMGGTFGKFIQFIPYGVLLGLAASLFECFFILPNHLAHWLNPIKKQKNTNNKQQNFSLKKKLADLYQSILKIVFKIRYLMVVFFVLIIFGTMVLYKSKMRFILFPQGTIAQFSIVVKGQSHHSLEQTHQIIKDIEKEVGTISKQEVLDYTSISGQLSSRRGRGVTGNQYGQVRVYLSESNQRNRSADQIISEIKQKLPEMPEGFMVNVRKSRAGPPVGKPVSIEVRGDSYDQILQAVEEIKVMLETEPGVSDIEDTFREGKQEVHVVVDPVLAASAGLNLKRIGQTVRSSFEGAIASSIRTVSQQIDIRVFLDEQQRKDLNSLSELKIPNDRGRLVPLKKIASFKKDRSVAAYEHQANQRQVIVQAELDYKQNSPIKVNHSMQKKVETLKQKYPDLGFFFAGENKDTQENFSEFFRVVVITLIGIILLLILLFKNLYQPLLVSVTIPLAIAPVIWAFYLQGMTISFLALIGMVALIGVIVNNSIILTSFVNSNIKKGYDEIESILLACKNRLRPILLTTITTVCGIMPTAYGIGGLDPFVVPLAMALGWGLAIGSLLVLVFYPAWLAIAVDYVRLKRWVVGIFLKN